MILTNSVLVSVGCVLALALVRVNVVIALTMGALLGGLLDGFSLQETLKIFSDGLGGGAEIAFSYAILGAFAAAVAHSGVPIWLSQKIVQLITRQAHQSHHIRLFRWLIIGIIGGISICSKNILPVHIAFIPVLIPPLLGIFSELKIDRRLISNVMVFGLVFAYMIIPYGFGDLFLNGILRTNLVQNGLEVSMHEILMGMLLPALGAMIGLSIALYVYRKPRTYQVLQEEGILEQEHCTIRDIIVSGIAIMCALGVQLKMQNTMLSALAGFCIFKLGGVVHWKESDNVVTQGFKMMSLIAFIMLAASGFSAVLRATGGINELVTWLSQVAYGNQIFAVLGMLAVGLLITLGIGSSFSTVPIIAGIYVPLCQALGFSTVATVCLIGASAVAGDAGSPVSDTMLGVTSGLNADGQFNHMSDGCISAFWFFNLPIMAGGLIGALCL